jgi:ribulose-5-phosphate 4-epimerase/fuculose-1-phosphate aldolase
MDALFEPWCTEQYIHPHIQCYGGDELLLAPSGVHKERIRPGNFFVVDVRDVRVIRRSENPLLRPSECDAVFRAIIAGRDAGSVMHGHALSAVLAADLANPEGTLAIEGYEMLKGIRGCSNLEIHRIPVIANTPKESELAAAVKRPLRVPAFAAAHCIGVRDHGAYIWGADVWEAKRHAEVYHFLFEGVVARRSWLEGKR